MLKSVYTKTSGDWHVIELETGDRYKLGGPTRVELWNHLRSGLADIQARSGVRQSASLGEVRYPWIDNITLENDGSIYNFSVVDLPDFQLDLRETKAILEDDH